MAPWSALAAAALLLSLPAAHAEAQLAAAVVADGACDLEGGSCASLSLRQLRARLALRSTGDAETVEASEAAEPPRCSLRYNSTEPPYNSTELAKIRSLFFDNIDLLGTGAVAASPDHISGAGGDYFYHWARDAALAIRALQRIRAPREKVDQVVRHYVKWVTAVQDQVDPSKPVDARIEPKFEIASGKPYRGLWCRPQTDGPGLRALALAEYGLSRIADAAGEGFVRAHLLTGDNDVLRGGVLKYDLDWVTERWRQSGCDLWEEVVSNDFFWGRYTMRAGLDRGAELARRLGDNDMASRFLAVKADIERTLSSHFNGVFVEEASIRKKDSAVIEAFLVGDLGDGLFAPLSKEVLGTVVTLNELFCRTFHINRADSAAGVPGILYGRYEGDRYNGGQPWVLLSASLAQLMYRQALAALGTTQLDNSTRTLLQEAYGLEPELSGPALGDALMAAADGVLLRIKRHAEGLHMAEQIDRQDGHMTSAKDLTWGYANVLLAMQARSDYLAAHATGV